MRECIAAVEVANWRYGRTGGCKLLCTSEHEEVPRNRNKNSAAGSESIYDKHGKRTMLLWMTDANGDFRLDRTKKQNGDH